MLIWSHLFIIQIKYATKKESTKYRKVAPSGTKCCKVALNTVK